ncbi:hypothetical protein F4778DRAFT_667556 [Xylariomycetidae sp. FL2044]|nr:hypothetical protein F4778DRAFT_667556 [Xylariomycetidae sp. FL2044]
MAAWPVRNLACRALDYLSALLTEASQTRLQTNQWQLITMADQPTYQALRETVVTRLQWLTQQLNDTQDVQRSTRVLQWMETSFSRMSELENSLQRERDAAVQANDEAKAQIHHWRDEAEKNLVKIRDDSIAKYHQSRERAKDKAHEEIRLWREAAEQSIQKERDDAAAAKNDAVEQLRRVKEEQQTIRQELDKAREDFRRSCQETEESLQDKDDELAEKTFQWQEQAAEEKQQQEFDRQVLDADRRDLDHRIETVQRESEKLEAMRAEIKQTGQIDDVLSGMEKLTVDLEARGNVATENHRELYERLERQAAKIGRLEQVGTANAQELLKARDLESQQTTSLAELGQKCSSQEQELEKARQLTSQQTIRLAQIEQKCSTQLTQLQEARGLALQRTAQLTVMQANRDSLQLELCDAHDLASQQAQEIVDLSRDHKEAHDLASRQAQEIADLSRDHEAAVRLARINGTRVGHLERELVRQVDQVEPLRESLDQSERARSKAAAELKSAQKTISSLTTSVNTYKRESERESPLRQQMRIALETPGFPRELVPLAPVPLEAPFYWPEIHGNLAVRLRKFRPKVENASTLTASQIATRFIEACAVETTWQRLNWFLTEGDTGIWYCFDTVCQLGPQSIDSPARDTCKYHHGCLQIKRPLGTIAGNIFCRGS